ncbi:MAG: C69 family dipeptidase [Rhodospirillales bacterium]|nr:C69 family dipeptidase [Rhodospirillales bacterium]
MSYGLYVGKNLTADGIAYLAGYGDEPSSHWLEVVPRTTHGPEETITVGVTPEADLPGVLTEIPQATETARHIRVSYSFYKGVPAPLTNGGLNEYGVAVRDIWSSSRSELIDMTPTDQSGPNYSDLARIVVERARSARDGVELIGALIARHGYSSYGGNSHLIADPEEAWVVIECAGGQGLWAAERLGPDSIRASRPGYIGVIPVHGTDHPDYLYAPNLVSFATSQGWYDPNGTAIFNFNDIYGDGKLRWDGVEWIEGEMTARAARPEKISITDMMWAIRTSKLTGDTAGYGQVVPLTHPAHDALRVLWHTQIGSIAAPFAPVFLGVENVPEEFRQHRYLTTGESARFMDSRKLDAAPDSVSVIPQGIESTRSASGIFKRLLYLILQHEEKFLPEITEVWEAVEKRLIAEHGDVVRTASALLSAGEKGLAVQYLTYYCHTELRAALDLADALAQSLEARTRALFGISDDPAHKTAEQIW